MGKWLENEVRFQVESRTRIIDEREGKSEDYIQCASCKSEDTFAERDLFYDDNYDFLPVFGPEYGVVFRRKAWLNPNYRTVMATEDMWNGQRYHLTACPEAAALQSPGEILRETRGWAPLVAQTEIHDENTGLRAIIEYPVKTMNTKQDGMLYQIDTGPIVYPDLTARPDRLVETLVPAYVAFNAPHFADFVIERPTSAGHPDSASEVKVHHYSERISLPAENRLYAVR
jgi:hypothetical protein